MSWLIKLKKNKKVKVMSSEEALQDVEPYFSDEELEMIKKNSKSKKRSNGMIGENDPPKSKPPGIPGSNKNKK